MRSTTIFFEERVSRQGKVGGGNITSGTSTREIHNYMCGRVRDTEDCNWLNNPDYNIL